MISAGAYHTITQNQQGEVFACGLNNFGQLGFTDTTNRNKLTKISTLPPIHKIIAGSAHNLALDAFGKVWSWGFGVYGQLGYVVPNKFTAIPREIPGLSNIVEIAAGKFHSLAIDSQGNVWTWGCNRNGQLGLGNLVDKHEPTKLSFYLPIIHIAVGYYHSFIVDVEGDVWGFGYNEMGQLGTGDKIDKIVPQRITTLPPIKSISCNRTYSVFLSHVGTLFSVGENNNGQLGQGNVKCLTTPIEVPNISHVTQLSAGEEHVLALDQFGKVWGFGCNKSAQLATGDARNRLLPAVCNLIEKKQFVHVSAGKSSSFILDRNGRLFSFGDCVYGKLGQGDIDSTCPEPTELRDSRLFSCPVKSSRNVKLKAKHNK